MQNKVEISHKSILFTFLFLAIAWLVLQIRDILLLLFLSFILMSALRPIVEWLHERRVPKILAIFLIYAVVFGGIGFSIAGMVPTLAVQLKKLSAEIPVFIERMLPYVSLDAQMLSRQIAPVGENILKVTVGVFSNIVAVLTVMTFTFYFLLERSNLKVMLSRLLGQAFGLQVFAVMQNVERRLGSWVLGQLLLMVVIGSLSYVGLYFLRVEFALPLAIIAGVLEIVPTIGPILSGVPAVLVAFAHSPVLALTVIALYIVVQQVENNIIVPLVMRKSVGLPPVMTILALMVGARFAGVAGAILAVPVLLTIEEIIAASTGRQKQE